MPANRFEITDVERILRRRAAWRRVLLVLVVLLFSSVVVGNLWRQVLGGDDWSRLDRQPFVVQSVMSGDEIAVESVDGRTQERVRLLGCDAPDLLPFGQPSPRGALESYQALRELAQGKRVMLRLPPLGPRASDGRINAYVYLDGDPPALSLNERLVQDGWAYADRRIKHAHYKQFEQVEAEARKKKRGFWLDLRDEDQPEWRRQWLRRLWESPDSRRDNAIPPRR